ncbi:MAG: ABC transporter permease [Planctomycetes bacterium]|nr:ABC transporter permease [Planctomycetota bacterium]
MRVSEALTPLLRAGAALALVVVLGCAFPAGGTFFQAATHLAMLRASSVTGILALGMTLVILTAGIDLSVGSVLGLAGMMFAGVSLQSELGPVVALGAALVTGAACGAANGALAARLGLQPFIATLATMVAARGFAKLAPAAFGQSPGTKIMPGADAIDGTPLMQMLAGDWLGIPVVGLLFALCAAACAFALHRMVYGRHVLAIGGNETAARLAGIPVVRQKLVTYVLCGTLAGLAACCHVAQSRLGDPEAGAMYELKAIAAVVIGGTSLMGGRGGVMLTVVGVLIIGYIEKILSINGAREHWRLVVQGGIIVAAVLLQRRR